MAQTEQSHADLAAFAKAKIAPVLLKMRRSRAIGRRRLWIGTGIGAVTGLALSIWLSGHVQGKTHVLVPVLTLMAAFFGSLPGWLALTKAKKRFANAHIALMAGYMGLDYKEKGFAPPHFEAFAASGLLPSFDRQSFSHLIAAQNHGALVVVYQAVLREWQTRTTGKTTRRELVTVFEGQLLHTPSPRTFSSRTLILRDKGWFNAVDGLNAPKGLKRVRLADPHFEKIFEVYSTDQVEGRYLVDPLFMEHLMAMEEANRKRIPNVAFVDGAMLMTLTGEGPYLPAKIDAEASALDLARHTMDRFENQFALMDDLLARRAG